MDAKKKTVTVRMKDENGKDVDKTFVLTEDVEYFDHSGNVVVIDVFQSGDEILFIETEGKIKELKLDSKLKKPTDKKVGAK